MWGFGGVEATFLERFFLDVVYESAKVFQIPLLIGMA